MDKSFNISYTLDVLSFIKLLLIEDYHGIHQQEIDQFKPMLGTVSEKYIKKLNKIKAEHPDFIIHLVTLLIANDELHSLKTSYLLGSPKQLLFKFNKAGHYKLAPSELKRFVKSDFKKTTHYIKTIAMDLERLGFKSFWLEKKLPELKRRVTFFEEHAIWLGVVKYANNWTVNYTIPATAQWYVLAYNRAPIDTVLNAYNLVDLSVKDDFFYHVVTFTLKHQNYQKLTKTLKATSQLKLEYKSSSHRKKYASLDKYVQMCLKMALKAFLLNRLEDEEEQLMLSADYPFAHEIYAYLNEHERDEQTTLKQYLLKMIKHFSK